MQKIAKCDKYYRNSNNYILYFMCIKKFIGWGVVMNYKKFKIFPSNKHFYLTKEGLDNLRTKLDGLYKERRRICERLMSMDDKEKVEYIESTNMINILEMMETEVAKITEILQRAVVASSSVHSDVKLGSTVSLRSGRRTVKYILVNSIEADPSTNRISEESPLGKAIMGKKEKTMVRLSTPKGKQSFYKIMNVS